MSAKRRDPNSAEAQELRGEPLEVLRTLLADHPNVDQALAIVDQLVARNAQLERLLALSRSRSGSKSERTPSEQLDIFLDVLRRHAQSDLKTATEALEKAADENAGRPVPEKPAKQPPVRRPAPAHLRRVDNPLKVPEAERPCPGCGGARRCIATETTEVIELIPAEIVVRLDQREVLACDACDGHVVRAPMGDKVVAGGAYGSALVAQMIVDKYRDGLPLHRTGERLAGLGLEMPSATMSDQILWGTDLLRPLERAATACVLTSSVMHVDGTSIPVRDKETGHQVQLGALWCYAGDGLAMYLYTSTGRKVGARVGELGPEQVLLLRQGPVCADASNLFDESFKRDDLIEIGCNMHARRYFVKALEAGDARAAIVLKAYKTIYDVEESVTDANPADRLAARRTRSRPVYEQLLEWVDQHRPVEPPASKLGEAMRYLHNHRIALTRFLDDGTLPIDNGIVERLHRRPAIVRRNMLFAGSHDGARRAAVAFTILACCALADVDPLAYLRDVLPKIARSSGLSHHEARALLPDAWKRAQSEAG
ncbi:IS66 family transposase [Microcella sp.]|uniref:IS66 family transposase n=1 Tax=Microcella sp. TaxID=1913979 RepID=UPI00299F6EBA|nr:IS66 family transposase [Microcella sp.]MDX2026983.1 IS66 family transposase [Microcella sp.]